MEGVGDTPQTVMTNRAPAVLKTNQEKKELTRLLYFEQADLKSHHHRRSQKNTPAMMKSCHYYQICEGDKNDFNEVMLMKIFFDVDEDEKIKSLESEENESLDNYKYDRCHKCDKYYKYYKCDKKYEDK